MNVKTNLFVMFFVLSFAACASAAGDNGSMGSMMGGVVGSMKTVSSSAVEVGNTICPVSGNKIGEMGPGVKYEYKGKIYNFCCPICLATFKKNPEKYIKILSQQMAEQHQAMAEKDVQEGRQMMGSMKAMGQGHAMMAQQKVAAVAAKAPVKEFNVEAFRYSYSPDTIIVNKGDIVKIHATSRDVPHGIFIKAYGINARVEKGKTTNITFVADKAGEFDIRCSVYCGPGHRYMRGKLIVKG